MSRHGWKGTQVRHKDGQTGAIESEYEGFMHLVLSIRTENGEQATIQLNADGRDSGADGWQWLSPNFSEGPSWLPLGDHSGCEIEPFAEAAPSPR